MIDKTLYPTLNTWFSRPDRWAKNAAARNSEGDSIDPEEAPPGAIKAMCLGFAIDAIYGEGSPWAAKVRDLALAEINARIPAEEKHYTSIAEWNDEPGRKFKHIRQLVLKITDLS